MSGHNRRPDYWKYYELAQESEQAYVKSTLIEAIRDNPCPRPKGSSRGCPPVHSKQKLDFACLLMIARQETCRGMESDMRDMRTPRDSEPVPDHATPVRHLQTIPKDWRDRILAGTARRCIIAAGQATGPLGADSSGVETTGYEAVTRPNKKERDFVETLQKQCLKYRITAILGLQIILTAFTTASSVNDTTMLPVMLDMMRRQGLDPSGRFFDGDKGYDSDENCETLFEMGFIPNIRQRRDAVNRGKPGRKKAAGLFGQDECRKRGMIEGVFGAEEAKRHQLHCRFIREDNRLRSAKIRAIAWNIKVLNRFECASKLRIPIPAYGGLARAACA